MDSKILDLEKLVKDLQKHPGDCSSNLEKVVSFLAEFKKKQGFYCKFSFIFQYFCIFNY